MDAGQVAQRTVMAAQQQPTSQGDFNSNNLIKGIDLEPFIGKRCRHNLPLAARPGQSWCGDAPAQCLSLPLAQLIAIPYQRQGSLRRIAPPK
jgi:hypothetical protein